MVNFLSFSLSLELVKVKMKVATMLFALVASVLAAPTQNITSFTTRDSDNITTTTATKSTHIRLIPQNLNLNETTTHGARILPQDSINNTFRRITPSQSESRSQTNPLVNMNLTILAEHMQRVNETMASLGRNVNQTAMIEAMAGMNQTVLATHMARFVSSTSDNGRRAQLRNENETVV